MAEYPTYFKRRKYRNNPMTYNGSWFQSKKEGGYAATLDLMKHAASPAQRVVRWEKQVKVPLDVAGVHIANWYCDFRVWFADGHDEWHEVKSPITITPVFKLKEKLFRALYPDRVLIIIQ